jgi:hypothetical protein
VRLHALTLFATFALIMAANANAHLITKPHCASLKCRAASQLENLKHANYVCEKGRHYAKRWSCAAVKWLTREYSQTKAAMRPRVVGASSHWQGWLCIHSREGAWNDEGAPYYGGLQMSYGWMGRVGDAAQLSPSQQIAAADAEARNHGYNYAWMQGQWPNTFPPCAGYF